MKLQPFYVFYVLILFIVSACKPSGYTSSVACDDFPEVEILTKDSVKINEILIPVWMSVCDDKAVVCRVYCLSSVSVGVRRAPFDMHKK